MARPNTNKKLKEVIERDKDSSDLIETDPDTSRKFFGGKSYTTEDIEKCAKALFAHYKYDFQRQFGVVETINKLSEKLEKISTKPSFFILNKSKNHWVLFCIIQDKNNKISFLFKDPNGADIPSRIKEQVVAKLKNVQFLVHSKNNDDIDANSGPICLRNLKIVLDYLQKDEANFVKKFTAIKFCALSHINEQKLGTLVDLTLELSKNEEFKIHLKDFVDNLPLELSENINDYRRALEKELKKGEDKIDKVKIQNARNKLLNLTKIKKFANYYKSQDQNSKHDLKIQDKFPEEMEKLINIFELLDNIKVDKKLQNALQNISRTLGIDYKKMKQFYDIKMNEEKTQPKEKLELLDINEISKHLTRKKISKEDVTCLEELLQEIILGKDGDQSNKNSAEIEELKKQYNQVKKYYQDLWKNSDVKSINNWATKIKGHLNNISEALAVMDRAYNLTTGGYNLRDTQILAVLIFFHQQNNQGKLCQIQTGEGKTVTVALLATIAALQGKTVDVITSNPILAEEGVSEMKIFYRFFNLTVATNNPKDSDNSNEFKIGYSANILYGTIANFQFDFLKDTFEGFNIRGGRKFGQVILDEVDCMLVDNGGHIAKLAQPFPGMESLRYVYIQIWKELQKAEKSFIEESVTKLQEFKGKNDKKAQQTFEQVLNETLNVERNIIKQKILDSNPGNIKLIPAHLKDYVKDKINIWVKNAIYAKYDCHEHQQYRIMANESGEKVVVPVDYLNTGVTMKNTIWSNGLHQFIQLKHNLCLTFESLTSSFISNIGYIKNYNDENIFGMTGTLGSKAEQELLSNIYRIDFAKLPTYKKKKFQEFDGIIAEDSTWDITLTSSIMEKIADKRAVLVICETEKDLLTIKNNLLLLQKLNYKFRIRIYAFEDNVAETKDKVKIGDIILATNIAGRGTNFKTEPELEENGGLHVCVGFLPCNQRVEGQAFGRTSRQGNNGTANLVIRQSEILELGITESNPTFTKIKTERDHFEKKRLQEINDVLVKELNFKDSIFSYFSRFHRNLKELNASKEYYYVLEDLREFWAFWLEKMNFKGNTIKDTTPKGEFEKFLAAAKGIIQGNIEHNPYYCIDQAQVLLDEKKTNEAESKLKYGINMSKGEDFNLLYGAHMKLFEISISKGEQMMQRFRKAMANLFFIPITESKFYKDEASTHLNNAKNALNQEIDYIQQHLSLKEDGHSELEEILTEEGETENLFFKHINSRLTCLNLYQGHVEKLIESVHSMHDGVDFNGMMPATLETYSEIDQEKHLVNIITKTELTELQSVGLTTIYSLKEIHDVPSTVIHAAQGQIAGGLALLAVGLAFLPVFPVVSGAAGTLISEGVIDIVMELIKQGDDDFDQKDFAKGKFITYGISVITMGVSAIVQSTRILTKAISFCRKLSSALRKSKYLKGLCLKLADQMDKLGNIMEKLLLTAQFNKMTKTEQLKKLTQLKETGSLEKFNHLGGIDNLKKLENLDKIGKLKELSRTQLFVSTMKTITTDTTMSIAKSVFKDKVLKPLLSEVFGGLVQKIKELIKNKIKDSIRKNKNLLKKLKETDAEEIDSTVDNFLETDPIADAAKEFTFTLLGNCNSTIIEIFTTSYDVIVAEVKIDKCISQLCPYLIKNLKGGKCDNNVEDVMEKIGDKIADQILNLALDMLKNFSKPLLKQMAPLLQQMANKGKQSIGKKLAAKLGFIKKSPKPEDIILASSNVGLDQKESPYSVLGLSDNASTGDVRRAYLKLVLKTHPDKNPDDPFAHEKFVRINDAYEKLVPQ